MTEYIPSPQVRAWALAHGYDAELHIDYFNDFLANRTGKPYRNLDAAYRNCVRGDWGGLRRQAEMAKRTNVTAWWTSDAGVIAEGKRRGLEPKIGESMASFKARVGSTQTK